METPIAASAESAQEVYARGLRALVASEVPFLVGGGFALLAYLGRWRATKDIDLFVRASDLPDALAALGGAGFYVELTDAAWLAKATMSTPHGTALIDIIFCSYNGLFPVDAGWLENGRPAEVLDVPVRLVGPEEMVVSKCFVAGRDRFDGGDISSLIRALGPSLDWRRVERLMGEHWLVLFWQCIHYFYVFPRERAAMPRDVMLRLFQRARRELMSDSAEAGGRCRGPMLDPKLYRQHIVENEEEDPRPRRDLATEHLVRFLNTSDAAIHE